MNYAAIKILDSANGPGIRTSFFVSGCTHHCKGCFNECTWDFNYGNKYTLDTERYILDTIANDCIDGISILGGEPMEIRNQLDVAALAHKVKLRGKSVWLYSGYTYDELTDPTNKRCYHRTYTSFILSNIDVLVDGEFIQEQKDLTLKFKGSRNQRIIDMPKTLAEGKVVLLDI